MKPGKEASPRCESWEGQAKPEPPCLLVILAMVGRTPIPTVSLCGKASKCELTGGESPSLPHPRDDFVLLHSSSWWPCAW